MYDYDPLSSDRSRDKQPEDHIPTDLVPHMARRTLRTSVNLDAFRAIYHSAISDGLTTEQKISEIVGRDGLAKLRSSKSNPSPDQQRRILIHIADLNPEEATGKVERWRHQAKPKTANPGFPNYVR